MASTNGLKASVPSSEFESFFDSAPPLKNSSEITVKLNDFIKRNSTLSGEVRVVNFMQLEVLALDMVQEH